MTTLVVLIAILGAEQHVPDPPPLAEERTSQIRKLIQATKAQDVKVKSQLAKRQQELIAAYADFDLDEKRIERLQEEVLDLQRQSLVNYHRFQMGLRKATGRERFRTVKSRVDVYLRSKENPGESPNPPSAARKKSP